VQKGTKTVRIASSNPPQLSAGLTPCAVTLHFIFELLLAYLQITSSGSEVLLHIAATPVLNRSFFPPTNAHSLERSSMAEIKTRAC
jgi:hypothetical protein